MKKIKLRISAVCLAVALASVTATSCGLTSNMSDKEAYDFGYGVGKMIRNAIDN